MTNLRKTILLLILFFPIFGLVKISWTAVIFETNFDAHADWNTNGQYEGEECSIRGYSNSANLCNAADYPADWEAFRSMPYNSGSPMVSIRRLPGSLADHTGTGTGKAAVFYNQSDPDFGGGWPGDAVLVKHFAGSAYPELYVQFWMRTQAGWHWAAHGSTVGNPQIKFWRVGYWRGLSSTQQNIFYIPDSHPQMFMDIAHPGSDGIAHAYRCDPDDYYCTNVSNAYEKMDYQYATATWSDGNWHRFKLHIKLNTAGSYNGVMEMWQDGSRVYQHTDAMWKESGSTAPGFTHVMFGGNSDNPWANPGEQWYAMDDIVISTTDIPDNYIPGGEQPDTIPPAAPKTLTIR